MHYSHHSIFSLFVRAKKAIHALMYSLIKQFPKPSWSSYRVRVRVSVIAAIRLWMIEIPKPSLKRFMHNNFISKTQNSMQCAILLHKHCMQFDLKNCPRFKLSSSKSTPELIRTLQPLYFTSDWFSRSLT